MRRVSGVVASLALLAVGAPWLRAQAPAPGTVTPAMPRPGPPGQAAVRGGPTTSETASIRGRVIAAATGTPIPRAQVSVRGGDLERARVVSTDLQGRYAFSDLQPGRYRVAAEKAGFVSLSYGQRKPGDLIREVEITPSQASPNIDLPLPPGSVIGVRISNEFGEPLSGFTANVHQVRYANGRRELTVVGGVESFLTYTDDRGEVRLFGLTPGDYYVSAKMGILANLTEFRGQTYAPTYFPGVADVVQAQRVAVGLGQESHVNFQMIQARAARVTGIVRRSDGTPFGGARLHVLGTTAAVADAGGRFTLPMVWPGNYLIETADNAPVLLNGDAVVKQAGAGRGSPAECALQPFTVSGEDITDLIVTTNKCGSMSGRLVLDTGLPPADARLLTTLTAISADGSSQADLTAGRIMVMDGDWRFWINGLMGERTFRLLTSSSGFAVSIEGQRPRPVEAAGLYLKAVILNGRDITDTPIDFSDGRDVRDVQVILTRQRTEVNGSALDSRNAPANDYFVVLFPEDRNRRTPDSRFIAATRSNQDGRFAIVGLPSGDYLAAAVADLEPTEERDPEFLDRLERVATRVLLGEGESKALSLKLVTY